MIFSHVLYQLSYLGTFGARVERKGPTIISRFAAGRDILANQRMPSRETLRTIRRAAAGVWVSIVGAGIYFYFFRRAAMDAELRGAFSTTIAVASAVYLVLGAVRGFTLLPATTLVLAALPFFRPWPLLALTLAGILISSASIYVFSESLHLDELVARRHPDRVARIRPPSRSTRCRSSSAGASSPSRRRISSSTSAGCCGLTYGNACWAC